MRRLNLLLCLCLIAIATGCSRQYISIQAVEIKTNIGKEQWYAVNVSSEPDPGGGITEVQIQQNGQLINRVLLGRKPVYLEIALSQRGVPLRIFRGQEYKGTIDFLPELPGSPIVELPYEVFVKPWIVTNYWVLTSLFAVFTVVAMLNVLMLFIKAEAQGKIEFLEPPQPIWPIYPASRVNHFIRDRYSIGSGKKDSYQPKDCAGLRQRHLRLKYRRKGDSSIVGKKRGLGVRIESKSSFFYKEGRPTWIAAQTKRSDQEESYSVRDYDIAEDDGLELLLYRGYAETRTLDIKARQTYTLVLDRKLVLVITT